MVLTVEDTLEAVGPQVHQLGHSVHSSPAGRARLSHTFRRLVSNRTNQAGQAYAFRLRRCVFVYGENTRADPGKKWDESADTEARACYNTTRGCCGVRGNQRSQREAGREDVKSYKVTTGL